MFELLRRMMLISLGAAVISKEKAKQLIDELVERGEVSGEEGKKLYEEWMAKAEEQGKKLNESIRTQVCEILKQLGVAEQSDIRRLEKKIEDLSAKVEEMSSRMSGSEGAQKLSSPE